MSDLELRVPQLQEEIVVRVKAIQSQMEDKKAMMSSYRENIKALEAERDALLVELDTVKEQIKQDILVGQADDIIEESAQAGDADLALID